MTDSSADLDFSELQAALAGTWSIEAEIGRGGMGVVFLARDVSLDRPVAVKVLHPHLAVDVKARKRFMSEALTGARLSHPNVIPIYAVEDTGPFAYIVMGLVDGESVAERIRREGPLDNAMAERVLRETGWALEYAHAFGILHRDVTLDNILLERNTGRAVLADFGIAASIAQDGGEPLVGTPAYLAPELVQGVAASPQSDVYSLAVSGWAMLAGRLPFNDANASATLLLHVTEPIPSLLAAAPATPSRVARAITAGLAKQPEERPQDVNAFLRLLDASTDAPSLSAPLARWIGRANRIRPAWAFASPLAGALAVVSLGSAYWTSLHGVALIPVGIVFACTMVLHGMFEWSELRRLVRAGYGNQDIALALARQRRDTVPKPAPLLGRLVHDLGSLAIIAVMVMYYGLWALRRPGSEYSYHTVVLVFSWINWAWIAAWTAIGAEFVIQCHPVMRHAMPSRFEHFWQGKWGAATIRVARIWNKTPSPAQHTMHRPTELVLNLAIEDLWSALPVEARRPFYDVPQLAAALRVRISSVSEVLHSLDRRGGLTDPETVVLRDRLAARYQAGVEALERIRLLLARLGDESAPTGEFTQQLQDARAVERSLLQELGAHAALTKALKRGTPRRSLTPTPSPTPAG